ncbi:MAG: polyprenyl synthetase family protein [Nitrosopumilus sp.]|uniref:polyprenyl synthetase family protein n=1 Tax=Nitrosopumilus sp. TaxID=2024843 RepID=UPI00247E92F0|nr:polyprenyl synthetase family protein [Nitrosopumilus sp.]MCV0393169.1 polyprenyl synthetase family protein [Nitrosopumilus sp.]
MKKTRPIENNAKIVNRHLKSKLKGNPKKLYEAAGHLIINGGKRLRPYMVIKSCQILGGKVSNAMPAASAVEMIHNFTLVHDDIMDNDEMRHGVPTVHKKFGMPIAILAGDVLFSKAYQVITESKLSANATTQLISRLAKACVDVCEGQLLDIKMAEEKKIPSEAEYTTMICKKTAALFDVSCAMGAICATSKAQDISNLSSFGRNLGIAFQITDDLIGVMGDSKITKKPVGNDLREGKKSLPILMAIKLAKGGDKKIILKAFGNSKISRNDLNKAVNVIRSLGIEENVRKQALKYAEKAEKSLSKYSGTQKKELVTLLDFVVKRSV